MAKANESWVVLDHGPVAHLAENLIRVEAAIPKMPLRRVMTVARRSDGRTVIHNAIALDEASMKEIEALGEPSFLVVPNGYHRLDARVFKERYPALQVVAPRGSRSKVEEVVPVDLVYEDFPSDEAVALETLAGVGDTEGVMSVASTDGRTLVFNDVLFNMPDLPGFTGFVLKHVTASSGGPRVSRVARWFVIKDAAGLKADLLRLAELPGLRRIVVSHHATIDVDAAETLRRVAGTL